MSSLLWIPIEHSPCHVVLRCKGDDSAGVPRAAASRAVAVLPSHRFPGGAEPDLRREKGNEASTEIDTLTANGRGRATSGALDDGGRRGVGREPPWAVRSLRWREPS